MMTPARAWPLAGLGAGTAGMAASYLGATLLGIRESPVVAVAETVVALTPGSWAESAIGLVGRADKPLLVTGVLVVVALLALLAGRVARRARWGAVAIVVALAILSALCVLGRSGTTPTDVIPVIVGAGVWLIALSVLTDPLAAADRDAVPVTVVTRGSVAAAPGAEALPTGRATDLPAPSRRGFLGGLGAILAVSALGGVAARFAGRARRGVEQSRGLLRISGASAPVVPASTRLAVAGAPAWATSAADFYRIDTAISVPTIEASEWSLRIHGLVDRELVLTYDDLVARELTEDWVTLNCVSNPVGGSLIGNAWWSGVRLADLLDEAGVQSGADALKQTSDDGWTCGTPLSVVTDGRSAMLALAMNGEPLPIEHGFPVRTIVPGLYGYVSATKWVVDIEVTRFADFTAYWTDRGWGEQGPVKMSSRIDVPRNGADVSAGRTAVGGVAWSQHTGIDHVEVAVDGGAWQPARLAAVPGDDCWVPWQADLDLPAGRHELRVRATDKDGLVQTGAVRDVLPDGSTGWHTVEITAT